MTITARSGRRRAGLAAFIAIPAILFALAGCAPASSGGAGSIGSPDSSSSSDAGSGQGTSDKSELTQWMFDYAACMRAEGIDMPDPSSSGEGIAMKLPSGDEMDAMQAAGAKCQDELGEAPPMSPEDKEKDDKAFLEWATKAAECYRENGYDVPDPKVGEQPEFPADAPDDLVQECGGGRVAAAPVQ
jgi:hypothetical protein